MEVEGYEPENTANGDGTGQFFRALPNKSPCLKGENFSGGKLRRERLAVSLFGFMSGEMEKPLVICKTAKSQCFRSLDIRKLAFERRSDKKAWMTSQIMKEWLAAFNCRMTMQKQHVLLFLDNATCHPHTEHSKVPLAWFPPVTTNVSQPVDHCIIRHVNVHSHELLIQSLLAKIDPTSSGCELARTVSALGAVIWSQSIVSQQWNALHGFNSIVSQQWNALHGFNSIVSQQWNALHGFNSIVSQQWNALHGFNSIVSQQWNALHGFGVSALGYLPQDND
ncbi:tigger transposable element-derived protein 6-like [Cryptotermes secundus]|uniref:tigger transposable element-derived protein 6-like n=1 Tax=Cryptotermes secundus TaxID=105785 RepID=UPI000CD7AFE0|nr:tigger transposable element-derived protein 6-like [Cryptotermes secundus]